MACGFDRALLSEYIDDGLDPDERARIERHLADCAGCREVLAGLRATVEAVRALPAIAPPAGFAVGLRARLLANAIESAAEPPQAASPAHVISLATPPASGTAVPRRVSGSWSRVWPAAAAAMLALAVGWGSAWTMAGGRISLNGIETPLVATADHASGAPGASGGNGDAGRSSSENTVHESTKAGQTAIARKSGESGQGGQGVSGQPSETGPGFASSFLTGKMMASAPVPDRPPIIRSADMRVEVSELAAGYAKTLQEVAAVQAEIVTSSYAGPDSKAATLDIRVPSDRLDPLLASLAGLGNLLKSDVKGEDVSARLRSLDNTSRQLALSGSAEPDQAPKGVGTAPGAPGGQVTPGTDGSSAAEQLAQIRDQQNEINQRVNWATLTLTLTVK